MKRKNNTDKWTLCESVWKKRIATEKGISGKVAERIAKSCMELIEHMQYGNAMIAFYKQDGTFRLEKGTLIGYEKFFRKKFEIAVTQESVIYWSEEQKGWRRFMIGNLMEWRAII